MNTIRKTRAKRISENDDYLNNLLQIFTFRQVYLYIKEIYFM